VATTSPINLFVYGTLRREVDNEFAAMLARSASFAGPGRVRGTLYLIAHYPGLILAGEGGDWVFGDVYNIEAHGETLRVLDEYEGSELFQRLVTPVLMDSGEWVQAYVYIYAGDTRGKPAIEPGDFVEWLNANRRPR
jgi:gamma-glutamylcyclotransferase (GGCT)/AIG2-like uncharacterized protein YtfP